MKMPGVNVSFSEQAATAVKRGERGAIAMILRDTVTDSKKIIEILTEGDIPKGMTDANKEQIKLALIGYVNAPKKVIAYILDDSEEDYAEAFEALEVIKFDYLVAPECDTDGQVTSIVTWVKAQRQNGKRIKAVLPNAGSADTEGIINFATSHVINEDGIEYSTEEYCSRIAGIIAGTPITISSTYAPLLELTDCERLKRSEMDDAVDKGKLIVFFDGEKVKVARGVNSLVTTTQDKNSQFQKIKIVEAMDMIYDDIIKTAEDSYLGKYANSYSNKCLLLSAIGSYFNTLIKDGILSKAEIAIDIDANKLYLDSKGVNTSEMSDDDLKQADTGDKVFMKAAIKILDAIEEITLPITI